MIIKRDKVEYEQTRENQIETVEKRTLIQIKASLIVIVNERIKWAGEGKFKLFMLAAMGISKNFCKWCQNL